MFMFVVSTLTAIFLFINTKQTESKSSGHKKVTFINDTSIDLRESVKFYLYTRKNKDSPQQLWLFDRASVRSSNFNVKKSTKFMTHGWKHNHMGESCQLVKDAFLKSKDDNVVVVDWGDIAKLSYSAAAVRTKMVGEYIAKMIDFLEVLGNDASDMTLAGSSLGAQVIGLAGLQTKTKVANVVGLDPAGVLFEKAGPEESISKLDGRTVEIIHTAAGTYILRRPAGHLDFYANDGSNQPGCGNDPICSHDRGYQLYAESIISTDLIGRRCDSYIEFVSGYCDGNKMEYLPGDVAEKKEHGIYFFRTGSETPYGLGIVGTKMTDNDSDGVESYRCLGKIRGYTMVLLSLGIVIIYSCLWESEREIFAN